ncbi:MAG: dockerin type I domain-containing protein, partial [Monoglobaceae bacterium]
SVTIDLGGYTAAVRNLSTNMSGDVTITNGTLNANAIYLNNSGNVKISDCTLNAPNGVQMQNATDINISDCTINGCLSLGNSANINATLNKCKIDASSAYSPALNTGVMLDMTDCTIIGSPYADAVCFAGNIPNTPVIICNITGGSITAAGSNVAINCNGNAKMIINNINNVTATDSFGKALLAYNGGTIEIKDGNFVGNVGIGSGNPSKITMYGGTYDVEPNAEWLAEGKVVFTVQDGEKTRYKVGDPVAQIGETKYGSLSDALDAAQDGDTVTLLSDVAISTSGTGDRLVPQISIGKSLTLDLAGYTIGYSDEVKNGSPTYTPAFFEIPAGVDVTITGNGKIDCEAGNNNAYGININGGSLTIENGTFLGALTAVQVSKGSLVVKDGTFDMAPTCKAVVPNYAKYVVNAIDSAWKDGTAKISVEGGTFVNFDPSANPEGTGTTYVPNGYYSKANNDADNTFTVLPAEATVIDTARATGAIVTLDNLHMSSAVDPTADATYKVVVSTAPADDIEKANAKIEEVGDINTDKAIFDISVMKTDSKGTTKDISNTITNQPVTITLNDTPSNPDSVKVYHVSGGEATQITTPITVTGNRVSFTAPSFSTYAVSYNAAAVSAGDITPNVSVAFEEVTPNEYDIVLKADAGYKINRFMSADLTFVYTPAEGAVSYEVAPVNMVNLIDKGDGRYEFNLDGINESGVNGDSIKIGTVTFEGYGKGTFNVADAATNIVNTAEKDDNIVAYYVPNGGTDVGTLLTDGNIPVELTAPKKTLTVNVAYNNRAENQVTGYQNMTVKISGGDLSNPIEIALGDYTNVAENPYNVTFTENADKTTSYTVTIADILTKNVAYTVTVEGLGYRTARHTVTMTEDKTLNFWNNVKDAANAMEIEAGKDTTTKNFLAGDIVKDNNINIYDLSAVVSYFGKDNLADDEETYSYSKYDLNRDGKIDSKDVAYVLVSWDN